MLRSLVGSEMCIRDRSYATLDRNELESWLELEFALLWIFVKFVMESLDVFHCGNPFAQGQHDGVTTADGRKYQAFGIQFIFDSENWNLCVGFPQCADGTATGVASLFKSLCVSRHIHIRYLLDIISDFAALAVARQLGKEKNGCGMHSDDKISRWAVGLLTKMDGTGTDTAVDPFPEALAVVDAVRDYAKYFTHGTRIDDLHDMCRMAKCAALKFEIDLSHTRIAAVRNLLQSVLRQTPGLLLYSRGRMEKVVQVTVAQYQEAAELEAVTCAVGEITTLKQSEHALTGGFQPVFRTRLHSALQGVDIPVLDVSNMTAESRPPRRKMQLAELTPIGQRAFNRARVEMERRYAREGCRMSPRDLVAYAVVAAC
eukprot:TRINITY_DN19552_c0_g1_i2.p1 TRINITY_DN19552_c0_g1~~TRINITY_DN19552_c0_g1_i2.p1  ORF type:complete len:372 (+),score=43.09 TRINITY_DN19552_c0_g1_i2:112-1227(+)